MANKTYVLSDLHGNYKILLEMLKKVQFDEKDTLYILGDCCDRGEYSLEIYFYIQKHKNIHLIKGNHEIMMREAFIKNERGSSELRMWYQNGGQKTCHNYHKYLKKECFRDDDYQVVKAAFYRMVIKFVDSSPNFVELTVNNQQYVLIHAGINPEKGLYQQSEEECAWMREWFYLSKGLDNKMIIFGHTPTNHLHSTRECFDVWYDPVHKDKIGIDGGLGSFMNGQLNCLCLETKEVFVIKKIDALD